jgi:hypothetical protein
MDMVKLTKNEIKVDTKIVVLIIAFTVLICITFSSPIFAIIFNSNSSTSNNYPYSYVYLSNVPTLSIHQGNNANNTLEPVLMRYMDIFNPSINGSNINILNSNFTLNNESYKLSPGSNLDTLFSNDSKYFFSDINGFHIANVTIKLTNILNPLQSTDIQNMQFGNITTLSLTNGDNGQYRHFFIPLNMSSGYYILNVISNIGNYNNNASPIQNIMTVYTAKAIIQSSIKTQSSNKSITNTTSNIGIQNNPSNTLGIQNNPSINIGINNNLHNNGQSNTYYPKSHPPNGHGPHHTHGSDRIKCTSYEHYDSYLVQCIPNNLNTICSSSEHYDSYLVQCVPNSCDKTLGPCLPSTPTTVKSTTQPHAISSLGSYSTPTTTSDNTLSTTSTPTTTSDTVPHDVSDTDSSSHHNHHNHNGHTSHKSSDSDKSSDSEKSSDSS